MRRARGVSLRKKSDRKENFTHDRRTHPVDSSTTLPYAFVAGETNKSANVDALISFSSRLVLRRLRRADSARVILLQYVYRPYSATVYIGDRGVCGRCQQGERRYGWEGKRKT